MQSVIISNEDRKIIKLILNQLLGKEILRKDEGGGEYRILQEWKNF